MSMQILTIWPAKVFHSMGLSRHVDYLFKNLSLTLNFITKSVKAKDILKAGTDCTTVAAINWRDTRSSSCGQHLLFSFLKVFVISVTSKTELIKFQTREEKREEVYFV